VSAGFARSPSVLLVRLDAIGDALTLVPALAALRHYGFRIGAVLRPVNAGVFSRRALDRVHLCDADRIASVVDDVAAQRYGAALIPTEKPDGYRIARLAGIPKRIGFENGWGKPLKTLWVRRMCTRTIFRTAGLDPDGPHECEVVFKLVQTIVPVPEPPRDAKLLRQYVLDDEPAPDERIAFQVTDKWQRLGASMDAVVELARRVAERHAVRYIAATQESGYVRAFSEASGAAVETFSELEPWKNAIAAARAIVAPDSGAAHVAGMVGTPVVSCFAPQAFALQSNRWAPWAAPHEAVCMESAWPLVAADALEAVLRR
jgi:ADP-heptose:LPS heptosyltransferase